MKNLLLTGASGFLGWHLSNHSQKDWDITGTFRRKSAGVQPDLTAYPVDLTEPDKIGWLFRRAKPDAVIHAAAISSTNYCELYPEQTRPLNVVATEKIASFSRQYGVPLIFLSSAQVFDGEKDFYEETDAPNPQNQYGEQKKDAEMAVRRVNPDAAIVRIPVLFGKPGPTSQSFMDEWLQAMRIGKPVVAFEDEIRTFLSGHSAAAGLFALLRQFEGGIYHLSGGEVMNRYEFALQMRDIFKLHNAVIEKKLRSEVVTAAYRPRNLSLRCDKIVQLGYEPKSVVAELEQIKSSYKFVGRK